MKKPTKSIMKPIGWDSAIHFANENFLVCAKPRWLKCPAGHYQYCVLCVLFYLSLCCLDTVFNSMLHVDIWNGGRTEIFANPLLCKEIK